MVKKVEGQSEESLQQVRELAKVVQQFNVDFTSMGKREGDPVGKMVQATKLIGKYVPQFAGAVVQFSQGALLSKHLGVKGRELMQRAGEQAFEIGGVATVECLKQGDISGECLIREGENYVFNKYVLEPSMKKANEAFNKMNGGARLEERAEENLRRQRELKK